MFEIRIICERDDTDRIVTALDSAFTAGTVSVYPSRDGKRNRLYVAADHREPAADRWPTPEKAYALAPSIISEIGWTARTARAVVGRPFEDPLAREFWLRKAAVLDRIALTEEADGIHGDAIELATRAAQRLMDVDDAAVSCDQRGYVRHQYDLWRRQEQRAESVAAGRCPNCQWPERDCNCADHPDA